jgi:dimethylhistidine N-methyltransferase
MRYTEGLELPQVEIDHLESDFEKDVMIGLSSKKKWLSSKYFYDKNGDEIFQKIMSMPSYYLTDAEYDVFNQNKEEILECIQEEGNHFRLIELGAGDGYKTKLLLNHFMNRNARFSYSPVDISLNVLEKLKSQLNDEIPDLEVELLHGDYFFVLSGFLNESTGKKVLMFLGSNIGNFNKKGALNFLKKLRENVNYGDQMIIGFDKKKDPSIILDAYNDPEGLTASFNFNLLQRINSELGGNFDISKFRHRPVYNPENGECKSFLLSTEDQDVYVRKLNKSFHFDKWETIYTEVSKKYSEKEMTELLSNAGFELIKTFTDRNSYFCDAICVAK